MIYQLEESNGIWYAKQFSDARKQTARAKLDTIRQAALWVEEMENYERHKDLRPESEHMKLTTLVYTYSTN